MTLFSEKKQKLKIQPVSSILRSGKKMMA